MSDQILPIPPGTDNKRLITTINDRLRQITLALGGGTTSGGVGGRKGSSAAPPPVVPVTPDAPNVTASVTTYALTQVGTVPYFRPIGTSITLPTMDINYEHLAKITVKMLDGSNAVTTSAVLGAPFSPDGSHNIAWSGELMAQATIAKAYTLQFVCTNEDNAETASPHTETLNIPAAIPLAPPVSLSTVVGVEQGPVSIDLSNQLTHTRIRVTGTVTASTGNQTFAVWRSIDNGVNYVGIGIYPFSGTSFSTASFGDIDSLSPGAAASWKVAVAIGYFGTIGGVAFPAASLPSSAMVSLSFTVNGIGAPIATGASGLSFSAPQYMGYNSIGAPFWRSVLTGSLPGLADPANWFTAVTVECVDASGNSDPGPDLNTAPFSGTCNTSGTACTWVSGERFNPSLTNGNLGITINGVHYFVAVYTDSAHLILSSSAGTQTGVAFSATGGERLYGEFVNSTNGQITAMNGSSSELLGNYNPKGSIYTRLRCKAYAVSRTTTVVPGWKDPAAVRQTTAWSGSNQQVIVFGDSPTGTLQLTQTDPATLGVGLRLDPATGLPAMQVAGTPVAVNTFESGDFNGAPPSWVQLNGWTIDNASPITGTYSAKSHAIGASNRYLYRDIPCVAGAVFYAQLKYKSSGAAGNNLHIAVVYWGSPVGITLLANNDVGLPPSAGVTTATIGPFTAPANTVDVRIQVYVAASSAGDYWVDDIMLINQGGNGIVLDPITGFPRMASANPGTSIAWDWDFSLSPLGQLAVGGASWGNFGSAVVRNDGTAEGNYCRLTNASANVQQAPAITGGQALSFACRVRSNNPGGTHSVSWTVYWLDATGVQIGASVAVGTASGSIPAWTDGPASILQAPAGAAYAQFQILVSPSETAGGYWDIGKVLVQPVVNQSNSGQTQSMIPVSGSGGTTILQGTNATYKASILPFYLLLSESGNIATASIVVNTPGSGNTGLTLQSGAGGTLGAFNVNISAAGVLTLTVANSGAVSSGWTGAVAGRNSVCGIVI